MDKISDFSFIVHSTIETILGSLHRFFWFVFSPHLQLYLMFCSGISYIRGFESTVLVLYVSRMTRIKKCLHFQWLRRTGSTCTVTVSYLNLFLFNQLFKKAELCPVVHLLSVWSINSVNTYLWKNLMVEGQTLSQLVSLNFYSARFQSQAHLLHHHLITEFTWKKMVTLNLRPLQKEHQTENWLPTFTTIFSADLKQPVYLKYWWKMYFGVNANTWELCLFFINWGGD